MAGEVIREVLVKVRVQTGDQASELQKTEEAAKGVADTTKDIGEAAKKSAEKQEAAWNTVERGLKDVRDETIKTTREYRESGEKIKDSLDDVIANERKLTEAIKKRGREAKEAAATPGGVSGSARGGVAGAFVGGLAARGDRLESFAGKLGQVALPVAIASILPDAAKGLSAAIEGLTVDIFGDQTGSRSGGLFAPALSEAGGSLLDASRNIWRGLDSDLSRSIFPELYRGIDIHDRQQKEQEIPGLVAEEIALRQQQIQTLTALNEQQQTALEQELAAIQERASLAKDVLAQEQAIYDTAQKQFGLLDAQQKQDFRRIAEKVDEGGIGSLSRRELEFVRGNAAFADALDEEAMRAADASGFKEIAKMLGLSQDVADAKQELKIALDQKAEIQLELKGLNELPAKLRDELEGVLNEFLEGEQARIRAELDRVVRRLGRG